MESVTLLHQNEQSNDTMELKKALTSKHNDLFKRLGSLENPYHNKEHAISVADRIDLFLKNLQNPELITERQQVLLREVGYRHNDGHCGSVYRQDIHPDDKISNEEYAVILMKKDLSDDISEEDICFMKDHILATSRGQNNKNILQPDKEGYHRVYAPKSDTEKLVAFADISGFIDGFEPWMQESFLAYAEISIELKFQEFIKDRIDFLEGYLLFTLINAVAPLFKEDFVTEMQEKLQDIIDQLRQLQNGRHPSFEKYSEQFIQQQQKIHESTN